MNALQTRHDTSPVLPRGWRGRLGRVGGAGRAALRRRAVAVALLVGSGALAATAAHADPVLLSGGYRADTSAYVACDNTRHTITLSTVSASVMYRTPVYTPGAYDNGQWVRYNVWISVDNGGWVQRYSWSPWVAVAGVSVNQSTDLHWYDTTQIMPTNAIAFTGTRGHTYRITAQIQWYAGGALPTANVTPGYVQAQSGYVLSPSGCIF